MSDPNPMTLERLTAKLDRARRDLAEWEDTGLPEQALRERIEILALARRALESEKPPTGEVTREHRDAAYAATGLAGDPLNERIAQLLATREHLAYERGRDEAQGGKVTCNQCRREVWTAGWCKVRSAGLACLNCGTSPRCDEDGCCATCGRDLLPEKLTEVTAKLKAARDALGEWQEWGQKLCAPPLDSDVTIREQLSSKLDSVDFFAHRAAENHAKYMSYSARLDEATAKLRAAEGRVRELEAQIDRALEHVTSCALDRQAFAEEERRAFGMVASRFKSLQEAGAFGRQATEGAKPAEPAERCRGESLKGRCVLATGHLSACRFDFADVRPAAAEPASPPSPAQAEPCCTCTGDGFERLMAGGGHACYCPCHPNSPPAQAEPVSELVRARELFDQAHDGSGVGKDYLWSSVGAILDHLEAERGCHQPPAAPGTTLTVDDDCPPGAREIRVFLSEDGSSLAFPSGNFTTVRACRHCGALITGGPTACVACVRHQEQPDGTPLTVEMMVEALQRMPRLIDESRGMSGAAARVTWLVVTLADEIERAQKGGG